VQETRAVDRERAKEDLLTSLDIPTHRRLTSTNETTEEYERESGSAVEPIWYNDFERFHRHGLRTNYHRPGMPLLGVRWHQAEEGDTLLHIAVKCNATNLLQWLAGVPELRLDAQNSSGKTAMQVSTAIPPSWRRYYHH
jgi:hypothetical protein